MSPISLSPFLRTGREASLTFILITVFLDVLGIGLIIPVLPSLVGEFTSRPDEQAYWYGILTATFGVMQFICMPALGALSDRYGRRPVLLLSVFGLGVSLLVQATATSLLALLLIRIVSGGTAASFSVANAYVADITAPDKRGKAFGLLGAAFGLGFIFGPVLGGLLGSEDVRLPFFVAASLALLNFLYGYFLLPESLPVESRSPFTLGRANPFSALLNLGRLHGVGGLMGVFALNGFAQFVLQTTWVLYTTFRFGWGPTQNGLALCVYGLINVIVQGGLQGWLLRRVGEVRLAVVGMSSATIAFVLYGLADEGWMLYAIMCANLLAFASGPALQAIVSKAAGPKEQGVTQGSLNAINSLAIIFAPLLGTGLLAQVGHLPANDWRMGATFFLCAILQGAALLIAFVHFSRLRAARSLAKPAVIGLLP